MHFTRRSFLAATAGTFVIPVHGFAQTPTSDTASWPEIQSSAGNSERTRLIAGPGIRTNPADIVREATELQFVMTRPQTTSMALASSVVLARAMGPDFPLVAFDAASGEELWRIANVTSLLAAVGDTAVVLREPTSGSADEELVAVRLSDSTELYAETVAEVIGAVVANNTALIYTELRKEKLWQVSRDLEKGDLLWEQTHALPRGDVPAILATNGSVVVGVVSPVHTSTMIYAWSVQDGELLWQVEREEFISAPAFRGDDVVIVANDVILTLDSATGEVLAATEVEGIGTRPVQLAVTEDAAVIFTGSGLLSVSWSAGELLWSRRLIQQSRYSDLLVCDSMVLVLEDETEAIISPTAVRGYDLATGRLAFEYGSPMVDGTEAEIASFLVANGNLYLATNQGFCTMLPGTEPLTELVDTSQDQAFVDDDLGFSYTWDDTWTATGTSFLTANGQTFAHSSNGSVAAQYAGPRNGTEGEFGQRWHVNLGPDDRYIRSIQPATAPKLAFVPADADIYAAKYLSTLGDPYDQLLGVRVVLPLANENLLVFEFLQAESLFDDTIETFAIFFENLEIS